MKIYLSGPITGVANYRENFRRAKEALTRDGYTQIINPASCARSFRSQSQAGRTIWRSVWIFWTRRRPWCFSPGGK